jgi:hypothetical protein
MFNFRPGESEAPSLSSIEVVPLPVHELARKMIEQNQMILEINKLLIQIISNPLITWPLGDEQK